MKQRSTLSEQVCRMNGSCYMSSSEYARTLLSSISEWPIRQFIQSQYAGFPNNNQLSLGKERDNYCREKSLGCDYIWHGG